MRRQLTFAAVATLVLTSAFMFGCSRNYDGKWEGTTSQGKTLTFTVAGGVITKTRVEYELKCERGGFCPLGGSIELETSAEISSNGFSARIGQGSFSGKFDSGTSAKGELTAEQTNPQCGLCKANVTWTAKKL